MRSVQLASVYDRPVYARLQVREKTTDKPRKHTQTGWLLCINWNVPLAAFATWWPQCRAENSSRTDVGLPTAGLLGRRRRGVWPFGTRPDASRQCRARRISCASAGHLVATPAPHGRSTRALLRWRSEWKNTHRVRSSVVCGFQEWTERIARLLALRVHVRWCDLVLAIMSIVPSATANTTTSEAACACVCVCVCLWCVHWHMQCGVL